MLGTQAAIDAGGFDFSVAQQQLEGVAQGFATLVESFAHNAFQQFVIFGRMRQHGVRHQAHDSRIDFRWRIERARTDVEQMLNPAVILNHDRQPAPVTTARPCRQTLDHFLLQHEVHVANQVGVVQQVENQRCGDVVRQVADYAQTAGGGIQAIEVEFQRITLMQVEIALAGKLLVEDRDQVLVQLHHVELRAAAEQALGQCALARADFQQAVFCLGMNGAQDAVDNAGIVQEVLAKAFARLVLVVLGHKRVSAIW
ncbi:hypothetical protein D3C81_830910 [compost metagenome]